MKEFITDNLTLVERRTNTLEGHYSRYLSANFIDDKHFDDVIKELGGYTYNVLVGKVGDVTIFNGFTWISVHDVSSYEECDKWAKTMARAYQCDICKKCIPIKDRKIGQAYHVSIEDFMKYRSPEFSFEICPDCLKEMKNRIENMEEN